MPSRTAMVLSSRRASLHGAQGDPIFGMLARGFTKLARPIFRGVGRIIRGRSKTSMVLARSPATGKLVRVPRGQVLGSKAGRLARAGAAAVAAGGLFEIGGQIIDAITGEVVGPAKKKRMNVLNPRALSRATRRLAGFNRRSKSVEKQLRKLCPPSRRRSLPAHGHLVHKGPHVHSE